MDPSRFLHPRIECRAGGGSMVLSEEERVCEMQNTQSWQTPLHQPREENGEVDEDAKIFRAKRKKHRLRCR